MKQNIVFRLGPLFLMGAILIIGFSIDSCEKSNMAKAGLQQCVVQDKIIWQKECK